MKHRVFTILWITSLTLGVTVAVFWIRSYWIMDAYRYCSGQPVVMRQEGAGPVFYPRIWAFASSSGRLQLGYRVDRCRSLSRWDSGSAPGWVDPFLVRPAAGFRLAGFEHATEFGAPLTSSYAGPNGQGNILVSRYLAIPYWFVALLAAILPLWRWLRPKPPMSGFCLQCGYDLRATPDRCPECGMAVPVGHVVKVGP